MQKLLRQAETHKQVAAISQLSHIYKLLRIVLQDELTILKMLDLKNLAVTEENISIFLDIYQHSLIPLKGVKKNIKHLILKMRKPEVGQVVTLLNTVLNLSGAEDVEYFIGLVNKLIE